MRHLNNSRRIVSEISAFSQFQDVRAGYLAEKFDGRASKVLVRASPSSTGLPAFKALVNWPVPLSGPYGVDTMVTLAVVRGRLTVIGFSGPPAFSGAWYRKASVQAITTGTAGLTQASFTTTALLYDTDSYLDDPNDNLVAPFKGKYDLYVGGMFEANATGQRIVALYINGVVAIQATWTVGLAKQNGQSFLLPAYPMAAGDTLGLYVAHNVGSNQNLTEGQISMVLRQ